MRKPSPLLPAITRKLFVLPISQNAQSNAWTRAWSSVLELSSATVQRRLYTAVSPTVLVNALQSSQTTRVGKINCIEELERQLSVAELNHCLSLEQVAYEMYDFFTSFISLEISNFDTSTFYENPSYIYHSYLAGELLD
jgi:hypothetical protein